MAQRHGRQQRRSSGVYTALTIPPVTSPQSPPATPLHSYSSWFDLHIGCNCGQRTGRLAGPALPVSESSDWASSSSLPALTPVPAQLFSYFSCDSLPYSQRTGLYRPVLARLWLYTPSLPSYHSANSYHLASLLSPLLSSLFLIFFLRNISEFLISLTVYLIQVNMNYKSNWLCNKVLHLFVLFCSLHKFKMKCINFQRSNPSVNIFQSCSAESKYFLI